jgi:PAS domain S-box-containing protein
MAPNESDSASGGACAALADVLDALDEGLLIADAADRVLAVNGRFCALAGLRREALAGRRLTDCSANPLIERLIALGRRLRDGGLERPLVEHLGLGATEVMLRIRFVALDGHPRALVTTAVDVTELARARRAAEQASAAKGQFLANMSHEIRTPLNGVIGITEVALRSDPPQRLREQLEMIQASGESLMTLVNDVLDFSRAEAGRIELRPEPFAPRALLGQTVSALKVDAAAAGLELQLQLADDIPERVVGDPGRLRQVLVNLLGNAVKFTPSGWVRLAVAVRHHDDAAVKLRFEVADSGIGIAADQQAAIFEAFTQIDASPTRRHGGAGLGLAISARLVELMGGRLRLDSRPGRGARFWFELVLGRAASRRGPDRAAAEPRPATDHVAPAERPLRVLLAEDNPINQRVATSMLEQRGHAVEVVADGRAALAAVLRGGCDVVLMDVQMPELDGFEATRRIRRARPADEGPRIVAMTAHALQGDRQRCLDAGMDAYLAKPFSASALYAAVERSAGPAAAGTDPAAATAPVLDREALEARTRGDRGLAAELVDIFRASTPELVAQMRAGLDADDATGVVRAAHSLKGAAAMLAAEGVRAAAYRLEMVARGESLSGAAEALTALEDSLERLQPELNALLGRG